MVKKILLLLFSSLLLGNQQVVSINDVDFTENEFFEFYPKTEWDRIAQRQKERIMKDFIRKKVAVFAAKEENFTNNPRTAIKLRNKSDYLFVNKTYEKLVALPLVSEEYLKISEKYITKDLNISHILIGFVGCEMPGDFTITKQEAYDEASSILSLISDSTSFNETALQVSDDPGVSSNKGNLGWITWGKVDPEFQTKVFELSKGDYSDPILTKYGYHIVYVEDERYSEAKNFPADKLKEKIEYTSLSAVKDRLKETADKHDKKLLADINFKFNETVIEELGLILAEHQKKNTYMNNVDIVPVLDSYAKDEIIVVFNNKGYGIKWFINKISKSSPSSRPSITNSENLRLALKTLILQILAIEKGKEHKLNDSYGFKAQYSGMEAEILYDAYVRALVNNAPEPTENELQKYYNQYKKTKYKEPERYSVYNLKVKTQGLADSLYGQIQAGSDFFELAKEFSLLSPNKSGKMHPFDKSKNKDIITALKGTQPGNYSNVFQARDKKWSIVYFEEMISEEILPFDRVKNRIKTALTKENQDYHKEDTFKRLNEKYSVSLNKDFFNFESGSR